MRVPGHSPEIVSGHPDSAIDDLLLCVRTSSELAMVVARKQRLPCSDWMTPVPRRLSQRSAEGRESRLALPILALFIEPLCAHGPRTLLGRLRKCPGQAKGGVVVHEIALGAVASNLEGGEIGLCEDGDFLGASV